MCVISFSIITAKQLSFACDEALKQVVAIAVVVVVWERQQVSWLRFMLFMHDADHLFCEHILQMNSDTGSPERHPKRCKKKNSARGDESLEGRGDDRDESMRSQIDEPLNIRRDGTESMTLDVEDARKNAMDDAIEGVEGAVASVDDIRETDELVSSWVFHVIDVIWHNSIILVK